MSRVTGFGRKDKRKRDVSLNVYDLHEQNDSLYQYGLGFYHSGLVVDGTEYTFASEVGVYNHNPKAVPSNVRFRENVVLGSYEGTASEFEEILQDLRSSFKGTDYNVLLKNCNSFADAFARKLVGKEIPGYVNRMAFYGSFVSCLLPPSLTNQDPTRENGQNQSIQDRSQRNPLLKTPSQAGAFSGRGHRLGGLSMLESLSD